MDNLIEFAKEQCEIFPEDSYMGKYLRGTLKMLQAEPCEDATDTNVGSKMQEEPCEDAVSRKAVLEEMPKICRDYCIEKLKEFVTELPPVKKECRGCHYNDGEVHVVAEIEAQEKWLAEAGYNAYNVGVAFCTIKRALGK